MVKGTTTSGFEFEIDEKKVADMRVIDAIVEVEDGSIGGVSKLLKLIMTPVQRASLYSHCTDVDGRVSIEKVSKEIFEIIQYDGESKK